jgi:hypothetical protein
LQLLGASDAVIIELQVQACSRIAHKRMLLDRRGICGIPDKRHARSARQRLLQKLEALGNRLEREPGDAGDIGLGPRKVLHQLRALRVAHADEHHRDIARCLRGRARAGGRRRDDDVDFFPHQLVGERRKPFAISFRRAVFDAQVPAFRVPVAAQLGEKGGALGRRRFDEWRH